MELKSIELELLPADIMSSVINALLALLFLASIIAMVWFIDMLALSSGFRDETCAELAQRRTREWRKEQAAQSTYYVARPRSGSPLVGVDRHGNLFDHRPNNGVLADLLRSGQRHS
jgi:hypothetical protein